ncbi:T9SS type A sorting domain-containing protein [Hymenobacter cellulosilyticus]|uniref:T9SS type A sorting domain-containing protein n=1 Tax=Hymenobacter cellulosilyticus TaxID=2932248 RepID=A0A8T9Q420_9BACT|nr:T9SS type A sorting domain-containing protein [Hymenobacter cellulosilyticus]UOQ70219.1 T9SS type A sorting domain-containing protein [Hymenobacter cellulosilyticus]
MTYFHAYDLQAQSVPPLTLGYGPTIQLPTGADVNDIAVADLDHDGRPDLAIPERALDTLAIFVQTASGGFPAKASARYFFSRGPHTIVPLALNGYGASGSPVPVADDLVLGARQSIQLYLLDNMGTAPGQLSLVARPALRWGPLGGSPPTDPRLLTAPLNGDDYPDIAYLYNPIGTVQAGLGGNGILFRNTPPDNIASPLFYQAPFRPVDASLACMYVPDAYNALLASPTTNEIIIVSTTGKSQPSNGWWTSGYQRKTASGGTRPVAAAGADVDGDGDADLVAAHETNPNVVIRLREPNPVTPYDLLFPTQLTYPLLGAPRQVILQDMNGDNRPDLLVLLTTGLVQVFRNTGQSGQALFDAPILLATGSRPAYLRLADINADGQLDLAVACPGDNTVHLFYNQSVVLSAQAAKSKQLATVYPNPAHTTLQLRSTTGSPIHAAILLDALGRPVRQWDAPATSLNVADVPRGLYLLQLQVGTTKTMHRIVLE